MAVAGLERLNRQLRALAPSVARDMALALDKEAGDMAQAVARAAPDPKLSASVGHGPKAPHGPSGALRGGGSGDNGRATVLAGFGLHQEVWAGSHEAFWARWTEFGTAAHDIAPKNRKALAFNTSSGRAFAMSVHHPGERAQPYFYPTIRARKRLTKSRLVRAGSKAAKAMAAQ